MLTHAPMTTILPVKDLGRACDFYGKQLGLAAAGLQADGKFLFNCNGGAVLARSPWSEAVQTLTWMPAFNYPHILEPGLDATRPVLFAAVKLPAGSCPLAVRKFTSLASAAR